MALQEGDNPGGNRLKRDLERVQRDLAINRFIGEAKGKIGNFDRRETDQINIFKFDFADDFADDYIEGETPLHVIIPGLSGQNYMVDYEEFITDVWQEVIGKRAIPINGNRKGTLPISGLLTLTPRLESLEFSDTTIMVSAISWDLVPPEHRSGKLSSFRYSLTEDSLYTDPPPLSEIWAVVGDKGQGGFEEPVAASSVPSRSHGAVFSGSRPR